MQNYFVREILRSFTDLLNKLFTLWRDFGRALNELLVRLALFRDRLEKNKTLFSLASAH
jgi:ABC-type transporter Mla subunit MlaD